MRPQYHPSHLQETVEAKSEKTNRTFVWALVKELARAPVSHLALSFRQLPLLAAVGIELVVFHPLFRDGSSS